MIVIESKQFINVNLIREYVPSDIPPAYMCKNLMYYQRHEIRFFLVKGYISV